MLSLLNKKTHIPRKGKVLSLNSSCKRASSSSFFRLKGSMALEGSLMLPLFLFYMATILYSLEMVRFQSDVFEAMHQVGSEAWVYAYEDVNITGATDCVMTEKNAARAVTEVCQYLDRQMLPYLCTEGGKNGVTIETKANYLGKGNLEISVAYKLKPFIGWLSIGDITVQDSCFLHGFVGYTGDASGDEGHRQELYVYITPSGTKYHISENCTYLRVKIRAVKSEGIAELRNASSEIYRPCEVCKPQTEGLLYLTEWGNRYHGKSDCSALKRTVYLIPISQVGTRTACSKCG